MIKFADERTVVDYNLTVYVLLVEFLIVNVVIVSYRVFTSIPPGVGAFPLARL